MYVLIVSKSLTFVNPVAHGENFLTKAPRMKFSSTRSSPFAANFGEELFIRSCEENI